MSAARLRAIGEDDFPALLALNNLHAAELSWQTPAQFAALLRQACWTRTAGDGEALLVALDQDADYDNPNFAWLKARFARFIYIDRVVVAQSLQGQGVAGALYRELQTQARAWDHASLVCEINLDPPNPASVAFHRRLGFAQIGQADLANGKRVGYYVCPL
ncbi:GNAT family N-acetyltransferase [Pseudoxanthomonas sp.]|uniref:GNAT family N-acetyltransferase n=1 Tax=Pseudoxanthomonas sp. TaxID=1871049 RepID=UPI002608AB23|nr:GNAT family N-acetyltransferase [Pseudoxanthomonas sp.]WDS34826.1 MAG: GNAT family N-acetyltransferase [Pseudoxanthomonas sp.]